MASAALSPAEWAALLDFHVAAGVDLALDEAPHDRFAESEAPRTAAPVREPPRPAAAARPPRPVPSGPAEALPSAADAAAGDDLDAALAALARTRGAGRRIVPAAIPAGAKLLLVGDAPPMEDDMAGRPFAGRAGVLLDAMLGAIGLSRDAVGLAHVVPWPTAARAPAAADVEAALPFLLRRIELASPAALVTFGAGATAALLGSDGDFLRSRRGRWGERAVGGRAVPVLPMLEPSRLLKRPLDKRLAWADLRALRRVLDGEPARPGPT